MMCWHAGYVDEIFYIYVGLIVRSPRGLLKVSVIFLVALYSSLVGNTELPPLSLATLKEMKLMLLW